MNKELIVHIEYLLCVKISKVQSVSGGDISKAYLLHTDSERFFCKVNSSTNAFHMFQAEKEGLEAIAKTKTIATPKVLLCEALEKGAFLLMEYVTPKNATAKDMEFLGHQLAALHQISCSDSFGFESNNFIGSLHQSNQQNKNWTTLYVLERLLPQLKMALDGQQLTFNEIPNENRLMKTCENLFPEIKPALLHGDLWSGNFLIDAAGKPVLIDPAVYYGHYEVDLAMTRLFGGFDSSFYLAHQELLPIIGGEVERTDLYQLYYLLVHLNLFGQSYKASVLQILKKYF